MDLRIECEWLSPPGVAWCTIAGELDMANAESLRPHIPRLVCEDRPLVLDLREVSFIDAQGVSLLLDLDAFSGGSRPCVIPSPAIRRVLELCELLDALDLAADVDAALDRPAIAQALWASVPVLGEGPRLSRRTAELRTIAATLDARRLIAVRRSRAIVLQARAGRAARCVAQAESETVAVEPG